MPTFKHSLFFYFAFAFVALWASEVPEIITAPEISNEDFLSLLLGSLNGVTGLSALGIAALVTQLVVGALKTPLVGGWFKKLAGKWKLLVVTGLSLASGILSLKVAGLEWSAVIMHSFVLTTAQVFAHQLYKQIIGKKD